MNYKKSVMLVTTLIVIFVLTMIQTVKHPFEYIKVDDLKIEIHHDFDIELIDDQVYLYLPINFHHEDVIVNVYFDDKKASSYGVDKMIRTVDSMIPQEIIEAVYLEHQLVTIHVIVE